MSTVAATSPYPWPCDARFGAEPFALVVAGCDRYWSSVAGEAGTTGRILLTLAAATRSAGGEVITLRQPAAPRADVPSGPEFLIPGATALDTAGLDGTFASRLEPELRRCGVRHVLVGGFGLEGPVHSTLRGLNDCGYECLLVVDACAAIDPALTPGAVSSIEMSGGIFGAVGSSAAVLDALTRSDDVR